MAFQFQRVYSRQASPRFPATVAAFAAYLMPPVDDIEMTPFSLLSTYWRDRERGYHTPLPHYAITPHTMPNMIEMSASFARLPSHAAFSPHHGFRDAIPPMFSAPIHAVITTLRRAAAEILPKFIDISIFHQISAYYYIITPLFIEKAAAIINRDIYFSAFPGLPFFIELLMPRHFILPTLLHFSADTEPPLYYWACFRHACRALFTPPHWLPPPDEHYRFSYDTPLY